MPQDLLSANHLCNMMLNVCETVVLPSQSWPSSQMSDECEFSFRHLFHLPVMNGRMRNEFHFLSLGKVS